MTIGQQNAINAHHPRPRTMPDEGSIEVCIHLGDEAVGRVAHYLDAHPGTSWGAVVEAALKSFLSTMP
jgi:hypothetical protein